MTTLIIKIQYKTYLKRFTFNSQNFTLQEVKEACKRRFPIQNADIALEFDDLLQNQRVRVQTTEQLLTAVVNQQVKKFYLTASMVEIDLIEVLLPVLQNPEAKDLLKQRVLSLQSKTPLVIQNQQPKELVDFIQQIMNEVQEESNRWKPDSSFLTLTQYEMDLDMPKQENQIY